MGARSHERRSLTAKLVEALAARLGPRLAPSMHGARRAALERKLDYAGRPAGMTVQRFIGRKAALAILLGPGVGGLLLLLGSGWLFIPALGAVGWFGPNLYLARAGRLRQDAIERSLPDFLDILAVSVRAGLGYRYALRRVAESLGGPVGEEMLIVLRQIDLGQDRRDAFLALRERNSSDSLKSFVGAQMQAEELGVPALGSPQRHRQRHAPHGQSECPPRGTAREPARELAGDDPDRPRLDDPDPAVRVLRLELGRGTQRLWRIARLLGHRVSKVAAPTARAAGSPAPAA